jgi:hypothetical protein
VAAGGGVVDAANKRRHDHKLSRADGRSGEEAKQLPVTELSLDRPRNTRPCPLGWAITLATPTSVHALLRRSSARG